MIEKKKKMFFFFISTMEHLTAVGRDDSKNAHSS